MKSGGPKVKQQKGKSNQFLIKITNLTHNIKICLRLFISPLTTKFKLFIKNVKKNDIKKAVVFLIFTLIPLIYFYKGDFFPSLKSKKMGGEFNIAIAEFRVVDNNGNKVARKDGQELSDFLYERLKNNFKNDEINNINVEIWSPKQIGSISGKNIHQREQLAAKVSKKIGADILIFGEINIDEINTISPEFYVNYQGFDEASEITGIHALGNPLIIKLPFNKTEFLNIENPALGSRINVLGYTTIGLAYYSIDDFVNALKYFSMAESEDGWYENAGKEIIYILIGNSNVRLSSKYLSSENLNDALDAYQHAIDINSNYERATVGLAGVFYMLALENPNDNSINTEMLNHSEELFYKALAFVNPPESANIQAKAHFGLGQIDFVRSILDGNQIYLEKAEKEFYYVINEYEAGKQSIGNLTSHAYARLGLIAKTKGDFTQSEELYQDSINISSPYFQCVYKSRLAELYFEMNNLSESKNIYQEAIKLAEFYGFQEIREDFITRLKDLD